MIPKLIFSHVVSKALKQGVQIITRRGKNTVVVMDFEEEVLYFPAGTHSLWVESTQTKPDVGGWQGGVPISLFGFQY